MSENYFKKRMENKNDDQLRQVINEADMFHGDAVQAAKEVLKQRESRSESVSNTVLSEPVPTEPDVVERINPRFSLRAIATYQILGSLVVMPTIAELYPQVISESKNLAILISFTLLYLTGIISAALIFNKRYEGLMAALIFNICQSLYIQIGGFTFYSTGFFYLIWTFPLGLNFNFGTPSFLLSISDTGGFTFGFNIVACAAVSFLMGALMSFEEEGVFPEHLY